MRISIMMQGGLRPIEFWPGNSEITGHGQVARLRAGEEMRRHGNSFFYRTPLSRAAFPARPGLGREIFASWRLVARPDTVAAST
jgi:hypothetical protein